MWRTIAAITGAAVLAGIAVAIYAVTGVWMIS
jgi:hypothetical protein